MEEIMMDLAQEAGLQPKRKTSGEYCSSCPRCGGKDRFNLWPQKGKYWCRQCSIRGDAIQFCRDFLGMSFQSARSRVTSSFQRSEPSPTFKIDHQRPEKWIDKAQSFMESCHQRLFVDHTALALLSKRGLKEKTIKQFQLGYNPLNQWIRREHWGLKTKHNDQGKELKLYLPKGIVIPSLFEQVPRKLKIRRSDWQEKEPFPKYYEVPGSSPYPSIYGDQTLDILILTESELDAMLIIQEAGDPCSCLAIGGTKKTPDIATHQWLKTRGCILYALDFDEAGKNGYFFWRSTYPNIKPWPVPQEKSPGDAYQKGIDLREWIRGGIKLWKPKITNKGEQT